MSDRHLLFFFCNMKKILSVCCLFAILCSACKDEVSDVVVIAKDADYNMYVQSGNRLLIKVNALSDEYSVDRIRISSVDAEKGSVKLLDTAIGQKRTEFYFMYTVPSYFIADTSALQLVFEAVASNGGTSKMSLQYKVIGGATLLSYDGIIMYSAISGRPNGLSLNKAQTLYCETADSASIDIYDYHDTLIADPTALSREWRSRTGLTFARLNDFDYAGTNQLLLNSAYKASKRYTSLKQIAEGDVIVFGRGEEALGVLQMLIVSDEAGSVNDRYIFNMKLRKIQTPNPPEPDTAKVDSSLQKIHFPAR